MQISPIDLEQVLPLRKELFNSEIENHLILSHFDLAQAVTHLGCYPDGSDRLIGCISLAKESLDQSKNTFVIQAVAVAEDMQGQGVGKMLMSSALFIALLMKANEVRLIALPEQVKFYEKFGFKVESQAGLEKTPKAIHMLAKI